MKIRINKQLKNYAVGQIVDINPNDIYWINRLKDAEIDNCIELVKSVSNKEVKFKSEVKKYGKSANK